MTDIKPDASPRRLGPHLPVKAGLLKTAARAHEIGATAIQIFTGNPTAWRRRDDLPPDLPAFRQQLAEHDIAPLAIHASYLVNLAGADEKFHQRSVDTLVGELQVAAAYGARFVNVHVGSHRGLGRDEGLRRLVDGTAQVRAAVEPGGPMLVLENSAGSGDGIGSSIDDLAAIAELVAARGVDGIAFCLDTAHLWAAGYCIDGEAGVAQLVERIDAVLDRRHVVMLHLNDSRSVCGSRVDRHEHAGAGNIGAAGLGAFVRHPWLGSLPGYLETPGMDDGYDAVNVARIHTLLRGEPLPALPPDAFAARPGRRARPRPAG